MEPTKLTLNELRNVVKEISKHHIPPRIVKTEEEAMRMTEADPAGHVWVVGEEYYVFPQAIDNGNKLP